MCFHLLRISSHTKLFFRVQYAVNEIEQKTYKSSVIFGE